MSDKLQFVVARPGTQLSNQRQTKVLSDSRKKGGCLELELKPISRAGIPEAIAKVELYRNLNEPGEAESICRDILAVEPAIQTALRRSAPGDVVVIAGKGHEDYQIYGTVKRPFSDQAVVSAELAAGFAPLP